MGRVHGIMMEKNWSYHILGGLVFGLQLSKQVQLIELTDDKGDTIHLMRGTALDILSPTITYASSRHCPPRMYPDYTDGILTCRDAHRKHQLT